MPHTSCLRAELFLRNRGFLYKRALNEYEAEPAFAAGVRDGTMTLFENGRHCAITLLASETSGASAPPSFHRSLRRAAFVEGVGAWILAFIVVTSVSQAFDPRFCVPCCVQVGEEPRAAEDRERRAKPVTAPFPAWGDLF